MEPFDILSTPARIGRGHLAQIALLLLVTVAIVVQAVVGVVVAAIAEQRSTSLLLLVGAIVLLAAFCVWLSIPQVLVLRRYYGEDRGRQVLSFRLDQDGWRWMQVGADVLMPWDGLRLSVVERSPEFVTVRIDHPEPVLVGTDAISRTVHRNLKRRGPTDVPFTHADPTEDELAAAIQAQSGGRVQLER